MGIVHRNVNGASGNNSVISGAMLVGRMIDNATNIFDDNVQASAFSDWMNLSSTAGYVAGEGVSWPGGTGTYGFTMDATHALVFINDVPPADGASMTGATSATVRTVIHTTKGHSSGGLRGFNHCEAYTAVNCGWAGGSYAMTCDATTNAHGSRPEFWRFSNCYFDNTDNGVNMVNIAGFTFTGSWFSSRQLDGCSVTTANGVVFSACQFINSWRHGLAIGVNAKNLRVVGCEATGNNRSTTLSGDCINVAAGATDFVIQGNKLGGNSYGNGGTPRWAVSITAGASDRYVVAANLTTGNANVGVFDGGTGTNKTISSNF